MKLIIFGIGDDYIKGKEFIEGEIVAYIDNYNIGKVMPDGKTCEPVTDICNYDFDKIIITSSKYSIEMLRQIERLDKKYLFKTVLLSEIDRSRNFIRRFNESSHRYNKIDMAIGKEKYYVVIPRSAVSGGPELLHQLAFSIQKTKGMGKVYIAYYSNNESDIFGKNDFTDPVPYEYRKYTKECNVINANDIQDNSDNILIIPEILSEFAVKFDKAKIYFWWLSVDNFFKYADYNILHDAIEKANLHLYQSEYARHFLKQINIDDNKMFGLSDYINDDYIYINDKYKKEDIIAYNPKKGYNFSKALMSLLENYNFVPIEKMNIEQVKELLSKAKVYIDFGNHPGKDRLPREAAIMKCCVICGTRGSAINEIDIPIESKYKINVNQYNWFNDAKKIILDCLNNYEKNILNFDGYRLIISEEKRLFTDMVRTLVDNKG